MHRAVSTAHRCARRRRRRADTDWRRDPHGLDLASTIEMQLSRVWRAAPRPPTIGRSRPTQSAQGWQHRAPRPDTMQRQWDGWPAERPPSSADRLSPWRPLRRIHEAGDHGPGQDSLGGSARGSPTQENGPSVDLELNFKTPEEGFIVKAIPADDDIVSRRPTRGGRPHLKVCARMCPRYGNRTPCSNG